MATVRYLVKDVDAVLLFAAARLYAKGRAIPRPMRRSSVAATLCIGLQHTLGQLPPSARIAKIVRKQTESSHGQGEESRV